MEPRSGQWTGKQEWPTERWVGPLVRFSDLIYLFKLAVHSSLGFHWRHFEEEIVTQDSLKIRDLKNVSFRTNSGTK